MQQLTAAERKKLEDRYSEGYQFIARDKDGVLFSYGVKPRRGFDNFIPRSFTHLRIRGSEDFLSFIKWEDEPYEIEELLKGDI